MIVLAYFAERMYLMRRPYQYRKRYEPVGHRLPKDAKSKVRKRVPGEGFTLIELLVVVSIIALLVSILVPALTEAREQAKRVRCAAQLHQIMLSVVMYTSDSDKQLTPNLLYPGVGTPGGDARYGYCPWHGSEGKVGLGLLIPEYMDADRLGEIVYCPSQRDHSSSFSGQIRDISFEYAWGDPGLYVVSGYFMRPSIRMDMGRAKAVVSDLWYAWHNATGHRPLGDNVAYSDGSVQWVPEPSFLKQGSDDAIDLQYDHTLREAWAEFDQLY